MAKNLRGVQRKAITVTAAAARTSGSLIVESGFVGVAVTSPAIGQRYALVVEGEVEIPAPANAAKGDQVFISNDGNNTVGRAAAGTAIASGNRYMGRVTGIPGDPDSADTTETSYPAPGNMTVMLEGFAQP